MTRRRVTSYVVDFSMTSLRTQGVYPVEKTASLRVLYREVSRPLRETYVKPTPPNPSQIGEVSVACRLRETTRSVL
ncbi:hypothetical protein [Synechococcus sp. M16CYN]|uniref:hypothetical protein n=1 Tax=Synechococcus sp. M16CYN TaxID=3103139 RepID=UPI00333EEFFB